LIHQSSSNVQAINVIDFICSYVSLQVKWLPGRNWCIYCTDIPNKRRGL